MSGSAPLSSSASPSTAPPAASAASNGYVAYDLRDASNGYASLASALVRMDTLLPIDELRQAVFAANSNKLRGRDYTDLDVYPPGSSKVDLSVRDRAARPRESIASVLRRATPPDDDILIIVARPLPPTGGVQGELPPAHCV